MSAPAVVPDWYLAGTLRGIATIIRDGWARGVDIDDDHIVRAWHAYMAAGPGPETDE